jgi:hypothetical protein
MIFETTFTDLSNWIPKEWERPQKGSSSITIFEQPETTENYFFKESHTRYELEFWSEIIASKFGQMIGLEVLDYNIGYYKGNLENKANFASQTIYNRITDFQISKTKKYS